MRDTQESSRGNRDKNLSGSGDMEWAGACVDKVEQVVGEIQFFGHEKGLLSLTSR